jgi:succinate dehydrogenase / fumarate reductase flavoprotein subunit
MQDNVGIVRNEAEMAAALDGLARLRERAAHASSPGNREYNPGWHTALDLDNLLTVSEAVARSALDREESRGAHFREDREGKRDEFSRHNTVVRRGPDGRMVLERKPIPPIPDELQAIIKEMG